MTREAPCYTLEELFALKRACPGKQWGTVVLLLVLAEAREARDGRLNMTQIAERMFFSTAAATRSVDAAEGLGLVARRAVEDDRRKVSVGLTARGVVLVGLLKSQATVAA